MGEESGEGERSEGRKKREKEERGGRVEGRDGEGRV